MTTIPKIKSGDIVVRTAPYEFEVREYTVDGEVKKCLYTGVKDEKNTRVFTGDILTKPNFLPKLAYVVELGQRGFDAIPVRFDGEKWVIGIPTTLESPLSTGFIVTGNIYEL